MSGHHRRWFERYGLPREIPLNGEYCAAPKIGTAIADADIIISMNHFKGHDKPALAEL